MVATAERIDFVSNKVDFDPGGPGPSVSRLTVSFKVFRRGPAHVSGLIYTTDFWKTPLTELAAFQRFEEDFEVWRADVSAEGPIGQGAKFEYVIFCDDHRGVTEVRKIKMMERPSVSDAA
jgi:hypothetical protein